MTAVQWFFRWVNDNPEATHKEYAEAFEQAKEMEKQQLNIARIDGINLANKGYGSKGSDEIEKSEKPINQTEISEEEMIQAAIKHSEIYTLKFIPRSSFIDGAKWYREQLKSR